MSRKRTFDERDGCFNGSIEQILDKIQPNMHELKDTLKEGNVFHLDMRNIMISSIEVNTTLSEPLVGGLWCGDYLLWDINKPLFNNANPLILSALKRNFKIGLYFKNKIDVTFRIVYSYIPYFDNSTILYPNGSFIKCGVFLPIRKTITLNRNGDIQLPVA